ncbi:hypothetical protein OPT61_g3583 [Boeremia exigua]|uniref:Uncharacterized protein n=1 Tax=Boeremia exigua TaxID=749465 RepID=A0ACC2IH85_9PLEO|nr:hypothetical protein OPT61_g3583 [Boeremia exigua]
MYRWILISSTVKAHGSSSHLEPGLLPSLSNAPSLPCLSRNQEMFLGLNCACSLITALRHATRADTDRRPLQGRQSIIKTWKSHQQSGPEIASPLPGACSHDGLSRVERVSANLIGALRAERWRRGRLAGRVLPTTASSGFKSIGLCACLHASARPVKQVMTCSYQQFFCAHAPSVQRFFAGDNG